MHQDAADISNEFSKGAHAERQHVRPRSLLGSNDKLKGKTKTEKGNVEAVTSKIWVVSIGGRRYWTFWRNLIACLVGCSRHIVGEV